jgi:superfamily II DNA or RNA helicase
MSAPSLRDYQRDVIGEFHAKVAAGIKRILLVAPTGAGKTVLAAQIVRDAIARGLRVLLFSHRREITTQTCNKLFDLGIDAGVIQAGWPARPGQPVQVASIQTLHARAIRGSAIELPPADLVVVDEAHHTPASTYKRVLAAYPEAIVLGLTATPCRKDGRGLGGIFKTLIECPQVAELVRLEFLVPTVVFAPAEGPDLRGVRVQAGDYAEGQLAERMDTAKLVGDVATHWFRHAERRKTVIFATSVAHSVHLRDEFRKLGALAEHIDGSTLNDERASILTKLARGEIEIVCNCAVLTEGFDCPDVGCIVLARPTRSLGLFRQMIGRGLRPAPCKSNCIVLDHAGAVHEHGFAEDAVRWTLEPDRRAAVPAHAKRKDTSGKSRLCDCPKCGALRTAGEKCRSCGYLLAPKPRAVDWRDGDLARLDRNGRATKPVFTQAEKDRWHRELTGYAKERGFKSGWVFYKYQERFGCKPPWGTPMADPVSPEVRAWIRSRQIAWAKSRDKQGAAVSAGGSA